MLAVGMLLKKFIVKDLMITPPTPLKNVKIQSNSEIYEKD